jgi:hypothetical protein
MSTSPRLISAEEREEAEERRVEKERYEAQKGFGSIDLPEADFFNFDPFFTHWVLTYEPGYSGEIRGHSFYNGMCRIDGLPKDAEQERINRRREFFQFFGNAPRAYRLYTEEPKRAPLISSGSELDEEW